MAIALLAGGAALWWMRRREARGGAAVPATPVVLAGLTTEEAEARRPDVDFDRLEADARRAFIRDAVGVNLVTIFNVDLVALIIVNLLLGSPLGALGSLIILVASLVVHVVQEFRARGRVEGLIRALRPGVTVVRDGRPVAVDLRDVVEGDILAVGLGDEVAVDAVAAGGGHLRVTGLATLGQAEGRVLADGEAVEAGSYCVGGHGLVRATEPGAARVAAATSRTQVLDPGRTPLEGLIRRILFGSLVLVVVFSALLLVGPFIPRDLPTSESQYRVALSIILSLAPLSLFFLLVTGHVIGQIEVARRGGLVYRSTTIEGLATVSTVRLGRRSLLSAATVAVNPVAGPGAAPANLARRQLGDLVHTLPRLTRVNQVLATSIPGSFRQASAVAGHLSAYGWQGACFGDPDMQGTFVIGLKEVLAPSLRARSPSVVSPAAAPAEPAPVAGERSPFGRALALVDRLPRRWVPPLPSRAALRPARPVREAPRPGLRDRLQGRVLRALAPREEPQPATTGAGDEGVTRVLVLAAWPGPVALEVDGLPRLPAELVALAEVEIREAPSSAAMYAVALVRGAGLEVEVSGGEGEEDVGLPGLDPAEVTTTLVPPAGGAPRPFPGGLVAGVGSDVGDMPALGRADIAIVPSGGAQAALAIADVVLVHDSLVALPGILAAGRRIYNGVMGMMMLNLSQVGTLAGLVTLAFFLRVSEFPFTPTQNGVITFFSIALPCLVLLLFAPARRPVPGTAAERLARFSLPSSVATVALVMAVFLWYRQGHGLELAQEAVTWVLVGAGLVRVLFVIPPNRVWAGAEATVGDGRAYGVVAVSSAAFWVTVSIPLLSHLLNVGFLPANSDYAVLAVALLAWAAAQLAFWRWAWREPGGPARPG